MTIMIAESTPKNLWRLSSLSKHILHKLSRLLHKLGGPLKLTETAPGPTEAKHTHTTRPPQSRSVTEVDAPLRWSATTSLYVHTTPAPNLAKDHREEPAPPSWSPVLTTGTAVFPRRETRTVFSNCIPTPRNSNCIPTTRNENEY